LFQWFPDLRDAPPKFQQRVSGIPQQDDFRSFLMSEERVKIAQFIQDVM
jgi:hypothetical protein